MSVGIGGRTRIETLSRMEAYDARVSSDRLTATPQAVHQYTTDVFDIPTMRVWRPEAEGEFEWNDDPELRFHYNGQVYRVQQS